MFDHVEYTSLTTSIHLSKEIHFDKDSFPESRYLERYPHHISYFYSTTKHEILQRVKQLKG